MKFNKSYLRMKLNEPLKCNVKKLYRHGVNLLYTPSFHKAKKIETKQT